MFRILGWLLVFLCLTSCDVLKESQKEKRDVAASEQIETRTTRAGDTLRIEVPKITYKDTTITRVNRVNRTEARITYDTNGNASVECISAEINELRRELRTITDNSKLKDSSKETSFQPVTILYIFIGLAILLVIYKKV